MGPAPGICTHLTLPSPAEHARTPSRVPNYQTLTYTHASGRHFGTFTERLFWSERELRMLLRNRSPAISVTNEDISQITDRFQVVYTADDDLDAGPGRPSTASER
jgi:hypothetical protein